MNERTSADEIYSESMFDTSLFAYSRRCPPFGRPLAALMLGKVSNSSGTEPFVIHIISATT